MALTPEELKLLDGITGEIDELTLAKQLGLGLNLVQETLERLAMMGVIELVGESDDIELDESSRQHIDAFFTIIGKCDYYELLGITREADRDEIKSAYYRIGPAFHPDRHFRKNLGEYKVRIERIFAIVTKAHDTLRYKKRRAGYDATVPAPKPGAAERRSTVLAAAEHLAPEHKDTPDDERPTMAPLAADFVPEMPTQRPPMSSIPEGRSSRPGRASQSGRPSRPRGSKPGRSSAPRASRPGPMPATPAVPKPPRRPRMASNPEAMSPEARRAAKEALRRKLKSRGGVSPVMRPPAPKQPLKVETRVKRRPEGTYDKQHKVDKSAAEVMRHRFDQVHDQMKERRLRKYSEQGRVAYMAGDYRAAAAAFEQASKIDPDDLELARKAEEAAAKAAAMGPKE
jgi:curved DNA-binding protein CbpA